MPTRLIREGMIDSPRVNKLDASEERFFFRLMLKADDFGRYSADPILLKNTLFPLKEDVRATDSSRWLTACEKAGLVRCYETPKGRFLEILDFDQRHRAKTSKYPPPPGMTDTRPTHDGHMTGTCRKSAALDGGGGGDVVEDGGGGGKLLPQPPPEIPAESEVIEAGKLLCIPEEFCREFWQAKQENRAWVKRNGELIPWRFYLKQNFNERRHSWKPKEKPVSEMSEAEIMRQVLG